MADESTLLMIEGGHFAALHESENGTEPTSRDVRHSSAYEVEADMLTIPPDFR